MKIDYPKNLNKVLKEEYIKICYELWAVIPVDYEWATNTNSYREKLIEIAKQK